MKFMATALYLALGGMLALAAGALEAGGERIVEVQRTVDFNFEQVDIRLLARIVAELTDRKIVIGDGVQGQVTVISPGRIAVSEVWPLFLSALRAQGLSVYRSGEGWVVARVAEPKQVLGPISEGGGGLETRVLELHNVNAIDVQRTLRLLVAGGEKGSVIAFPPSNHLIVTADSETLQRIEAILEQLDRPGAGHVAQVVRLKHASAVELAAALREVSKGAAGSRNVFAAAVRNVAAGVGGIPPGVTVVPARQANSLVVVGPPAEVRELCRIVSLLDVEPEAHRGPLNAIFLKYLSAEDAAASLKKLLEGQPAAEGRKIGIEFSKANNALLVRADPKDFEWLRKLVEDLDRMPEQVLVEILIAEVGLDHSLELGVEWSTIDLPAEGRTTVIGRSRPEEVDRIMDLITEGIFPQGLSLGVARGVYRDSTGRLVPRIPFLLRALAGDRNVKILSSVPLWAQNNSEASVSVVENIPVLRSTIQGGAGTARDVIQNIERVDVGIKLKMIPHVNPDHEITMELNPSIEAIIDRGPPDMPFTPTIAKREVSTTVTVPDEATIVISGLIREDRVKVQSKVPLLGDIPVLGTLFRHTSDRVKQSNLIIFVTPHIVTDQAQARRIREQLEQKTSLPRERIRFGSDAGKAWP